jgi:hypothetical protein
MAKRELLKFWVLTLLLGPIMIGLFNEQLDFRSLIELLPILILFSIAFSIPSFLIVFILNIQVERVVHIKTPTTRIIIVLATVVACFLTLHLIGGSMMKSMIQAYVLAIVLSGITIGLLEENNNSASK